MGCWREEMLMCTFDFPMFKAGFPLDLRIKKISGTTPVCVFLSSTAAHCNAQKHIALNCSTLQHAGVNTVVHCNSLNARQ